MQLLHRIFDYHYPNKPFRPPAMLFICAMACFAGAPVYARCAARSSKLPVQMASPLDHVSPAGV
jgi:hypothetical protein